MAKVIAPITALVEVIGKPSAGLGNLFCKRVE